MRILLLHSDYFEYLPVKKEAINAEEAEQKSVRLDEVVVLFTAVERDDGASTVEKAAREVKGDIESIGASKVIIYPYSHLSNDLASPQEALRRVKELEGRMKELGIETYRAPFGWTKKFTISIKGHPLAERLKTITSVARPQAEEKVSVAVEAERKLRSSWHIMTTEGELIPVEDFSFEGLRNLEKFVSYEMAKVRAVSEEPPHVKLMRKLEIADYEPASDPGNLRWPAKGRLIKSLLERYVTEKVVEYGAMEIETPIMYDFEHPSLADYLSRFPARQYIVKSDDKEYFLRFSACFGQFLTVHDMNISYRHLPLKVYELTRYSFRRELSGEVVGLRRLRAFTMPDVHAFCADIEQAKEEMRRRMKLSRDVLEGIGLNRDDYELGIRFTKEFYEENGEFVRSLVKDFGKPALAEMWNERFFYFVLKWEFNFVDNLEKASALSTDQIDIENAKRYDITFTDEKGGRINPIILHCSPSGAIERDIWALLEKAYSEGKKGKKPQLPLWLAPTQVRMLPVSDKYIDGTEQLMGVFQEQNVRSDIDDRAESVEKRVRQAETEWINYIVVFGQRESDTGVLAVRDRARDKIRQMKAQELIDEIRAETKGMPFARNPLPKLLSERPGFS